MSDFRDPMAIAAMTAAGAVLLAGLVFGAVFDAPVTRVTGGPGPAATPVPGPSPTPLGGGPSAGPSPAGPPGVETTLVPSFADASGVAPPVDRGGGVQDTYAAANAVDADDATAWCVEGDGVGQFLVLGFTGTVEVTQVALIPGYDKIDPATGEDRFAENRKIESVRFHFDDGSTVDRTFDPPTPDLAPTELGEPIPTRAIAIEVVRTSAPSAPNRDFTCISTVMVRGFG